METRKMSITYEVLPDRSKRARKKYHENGVLGVLEIPSGRTPDMNAWLTLTLSYKLTFLDSKNRVPDNNGRDVVTYFGSSWCAQDLGGYMFPILDWDNRSREQFRKMFQSGWLIWNQRFLIKTPQDYDQFDYESGKLRLRPNIQCLFRIEPSDKGQNFNIVRLKPTTDKISHVSRKMFKSFEEGFQHSEATMADDAWRKPALGHELGHALGLHHIKAEKDDAACKKDENQRQCYGTTPEELLNIMGVGTEITAINARPWREHLSSITGEPIASWGLVLMSEPGKGALGPRRV
jgi:hypothetical protein